MQGEYLVTQAPIRPTTDADATPHERFERVITIEGDLNDEQLERLFEIAEKCPIHKLLTAGARVVTTVGGN